MKCFIFEKFIRQKGRLTIHGDSHIRIAAAGKIRAGEVFCEYEAANGRMHIPADF